MKKVVTQEELEARLRELPATVPEEAGFAREVMRRVEEAASPSPAPEKGYRFWRLAMKGAIGVAACLVLGIAAWHLTVGEPRPAYGLEGLPERLMELRSLHVKGMAYPAEESPGVPVEMFLERPGRMRVGGVTTTRNGRTDGHGSVMILTPKERLWINPKEKVMAVTPMTSADAEFQAEQLLQGFSQMLSGSGQAFKEIGVKQIGNVQTHVYETEVDLPEDREREVLYLNPETGLPVRSESYSAIAGKPERLTMAFDTIEPNPAIPQGTFAFSPPADYQVVKGEETAPGSMDVRVGDTAFGLRFVVAIDDRTALICWRVYDVKAPAEDLHFFDGTKNTLEIRGNGGSVYHERLLHADLSKGGFHWRWSLLWTQKPARQWANAIVLRVRGSGGTCSDRFMPVVLPPKELPAFVETAQRLTLPVGEQPMSLQQIKAAAQAAEGSKEPR